MATHPDVLILGGGVIGLTTAYFLAREGVAVEVIDQGDLGREASWAGAGIIPPGDIQAAQSPLDHLRAHSAALYPPLSAELRERTGVDNGYLSSGGITLADDDDNFEWHGPGAVTQALNTSALNALEPNVTPWPRATRWPEMAQVRNPRHLKALIAACQSHGVQLSPGCRVHGFDIEGDRVTGIRISEEKRHAGHYLLATGAWTDGLLDDFGWHPGVKPIRGQIVLLRLAASLFRHVLVQGTRYLVPRPDGRLLIGSTEEDVGFDRRTTAEATRDLLDFALTLVPGLKVAEVERTWSGLRPGSPDGLPFLGPVKGFDNLLIAAGHFRNGIALSPITALLMKEYFFQQTPTIPLEPYRLDRTPAPAAHVTFLS